MADVFAELSALRTARRALVDYDRRLVEADQCRNELRRLANAARRKARELDGALARALDVRDALQESQQTPGGTP